MNQTTFEVKVNVFDEIERYSTKLRMYIKRSKVKTYHIQARTHEQAFEKAKKYGRPISAQKFDATRVLSNIEQLPINELFENKDNPYENAVAMDDMIWKKQNIKRNNMWRDKTQY